LKKRAMLLDLRFISAAVDKSLEARRRWQVRC
jgi:hypothetical protein